MPQKNAKKSTTPSKSSAKSKKKPKAKSKKPVTSLALIVIPQPEPTPADKEKAKEKAFKEKTIDASFRSQVAQFPKAILEKIDEMINANQGATSCLKILKLEYKGPLVIPSRGSMERYIKWRRVKLHDMTDKELAATKELAELPDMRKANVSDRRAMLDGIVKQLCERIELIKEIQKNNADVKYEKILTENLATLRATIESIVRLESKLGMERGKLQTIWGILLKHLSGVVRQAVQDTYGEKDMPQFLKALDTRAEALAFDLIEEEIQTALKSDTEKQEEE